jgi:hypothetical protein
MKTLSILKVALPITGISFLFGCQKEISGIPTENSLNSFATTSLNKTHQHLLKGEYDARYNFVPDIEAGWVAPNPAPAWYPATGEGHLNLLGQSRAFASLHTTFGANGIEGLAAPVNMFFSRELNELDITIPDAVGIIFFDKQGNSIWARGQGGSINLVSPTRATFGGDVQILGGTGKFANATGQFFLSGYFNPQNNEEAGLEIFDGAIVY